MSLIFNLKLNRAEFLTIISKIYFFSGPSVPTESPVKSAGSPAAKGSRFQADPRTPATPNVNFYSPQVKKSIMRFNFG